MAPTLVASRTALPPEGAVLAWGGPARRTVAPTLVASRTALPPEGAVLAWGGPARRTLAPTLVASRTALPLEVAVLVWGGPALRTVALRFFVSRAAGVALDLSPGRGVNFVRGGPAVGCGRRARRFPDCAFFRKSE